MKEFNTTGICIPEKHYMVDISGKLDQIEEMIKSGKYFTINKPRQYGKTTTMYLLSKRLEKQGFLVIRMSFEGMSNQIFEKEKDFIKSFLAEIKRNLKLKEIKNRDKLLRLIAESNTANLDELGSLITDFIITADRDIVLMIDEVDKSSNNQLFLDFLGMLRNKYLLREAAEDLSFYSIILASVYDIKNLKLKLRPDAERKFNSPWNIAVDFEVEMDFSPEEIATMLKDYIEEKNIEMNIKEIAETIYYYTSGHPFLVSKLSQIIDEKIMAEQDQEKWGKEYVDIAVSKLLKKSNTNFDSLIKNLENNQELYNFVRRIVLEGENISYVETDNTIALGIVLGIFKEKEGSCVIHNRVYEQVIYRHMEMKIIRENKFEKASDYNFRDNFIKPDGTLDFKMILKKFQQFVKEQYSDKDRQFLERNGRLLFLAFIKPIINTRGFDFKEVQVSQEKRLDVVITYLEQKYVVELKIWRGEKYHQNGLKQLVDYLERQNLARGYLISFNFNQNKEYREEEICEAGKNIYAIWV
jgi:hypothetical protein